MELARCTGGTFSSQCALSGSVSGDNFDIPKVPHDLLRPIQSTAPAAPWLFPTPDIWQDKVVVETQGGDKYTTKDIERMLRDLHLEQQVTLLSPLFTCTVVAIALAALSLQPRCYTDRAS